MAEIPQQEWFTIPPVAKSLGVSEKFVRARITAGELESSLIAGRRFIHISAIDRMMRKGLNRKPRKGGRGVRKEVA